MAEENYDSAAIGERIKKLRKQYKLSQSAFAEYVNKSLRTVQKYEVGEIKIPLSVIADAAELFDVGMDELIGYKAKVREIETLSDIVNFLFMLERVNEVEFSLDTPDKPFRDDKPWKCSITFDGRALAKYSEKLCSFLWDWEDERASYLNYKESKDTYKKWQEWYLAHFSIEPVTMKDVQELAPHTELVHEPEDPPSPNDIVSDMIPYNLELIPLEMKEDERKK